MSNIINPKPRFGFNPTTGLLYDYVAQRDVDPTTPPYVAADGVWDLHAVKLAILAGQSIESGHLALQPPAPAAAGTAPTPPTLIDGTQPAPSSSPKAAKDSTARAARSDGLSAEALTALKLSPLQLAALGIRHEQLSTGGISDAQIKGWGVTAERAEALRLTPEQRAVLLP